MEWIRDEFLLTDDATRIDLAKTQALLQSTYWGVRRPPAVVAMMLEHSLPFVLLHQGMQIGFGRVVSDYTVFSWVADIVIDAPYRGKGFGQVDDELYHRASKNPSYADGAADPRCTLSV
jgi:hypothetical protein